jgi:low temperature requirement protein LtrA
MTSLARPQLRLVAGANPTRKVTWLELFFDLVFVAAVAQVGEPLQDDLSLAGIARFTVLFVLIWWAWIGASVFATRFDTDDWWQRMLTLFQMFAVAAMAANAGSALDSRDSAGFAAAYAILRFMLVAQYARARQVPTARRLASLYMTGHGIAAGLWLVSALVPAPERFLIWGLALAIDLGTPWLAVRHSIDIPPDPAHLPERFGLFTLILLGESVIAVMHGMKAQEAWSVPAAAAAFLGMATAFALWWWYFDGVGGADDRHVHSHRDAVRFHVWSYAHLPLYLGIAVSFAGVQHIVHDGAVHPIHDSDGLVLGSALAIAMIALMAIGTSRPGGNSSPRLIVQVAIAVLAVTAGAVASRVPSALVVVGLFTLCALQISVAAGGTASVRTGHAGRQ